MEQAEILWQLLKEIEELLNRNICKFRQSSHICTDF